MSEILFIQFSGHQSCSLRVGVEE